MGIDPRRQRLRPRGLGIDQPARAEDADEEFDPDHLARRAVDQRGLLPREIDEELFAREMHLAHRRFERPRPAAVAVTELAVTIPGRMRVAMLQPEQAERDAGTFQLQVDGAPIGQRARAGGDDAGTGKEPRLQCGVVQVGGQGPPQARRDRPLQVHRDRAHPDAARPGNRPVAQPGFIFQTENVA